jgi:hypothetical protein
MTIKDLKEAIANLPDDGEVFYQRIEDRYFKRNGWTTVKMKGEDYYNCLRHNSDIDSGKYLDKEKYPNITEQNLVKFSQEQMDSFLEEYIDAFQAINYDKKNLYITAHY